ncbi:MAG: MBL fold metallo-hydrolase [Roseburia sp.]|nr:MBL fold metallo-hydrolase [Anaeroplasma bactoclasticum]MCM1196258.1 MBL fold metallo-hydrolase [Roseburia sp.]MCM1556861.1 MBL fold metallo-hydrolase [Anaeroplasma bactoclasticum]
MIEKIVTGDFETNTYIISNLGKCVIVDPGLDFENTATKIKEEYEVVAILLTHGHMDHIDGIRYFDVPIYIHELEIQFLEDPSLSLYRMFGTKIPFQKENLKIVPIKDGMELELIGYKFKVMHTPGHTQGSVVYSYKDKLLSGDTLFRMSMGRTDFPTGDSLEMRDSLKKIIEEFPDSIDVYPGHDEKTTIAFERKNNPYL